MAAAAEEKLVFRLAYRLSCSEVAGLGPQESRDGKERLTTVINGLSFDWAIRICSRLMSWEQDHVSYRAIPDHISRRAVLKLIQPRFEIGERLAARILLVRIRYEGEATWVRTAGIEVPGLPGRTRLVEFLLEAQARELRPERLLPAARPVAAFATGLLPALLTDVRALPLGSLPTQTHLVGFQMLKEGGLGSVEVVCAGGESLWPNLGNLALVSAFFASLATFEEARGRDVVSSAPLRHPTKGTKGWCL